MRDKLLDRDSVDIDVALDNMTGIYVTICEFAAVVGEYLNESSSSVVVIDSVETPGDGTHEGQRLLD